MLIAVHHSCGEQSWLTEACAKQIVQRASAVSEDGAAPIVARRENRAMCVDLS